MGQFVPPSFDLRRALQQAATLRRIQLPLDLDAHKLQSLGLAEAVIFLKSSMRSVYLQKPVRTIDDVLAAIDEFLDMLDPKTAEVGVSPTVGTQGDRIA